LQLLFDENIDRRLLERLSRLDHSITVVGLDYVRGLTDAEVLAAATAERRVLVTSDLDFGQMVFVQGLAHAGVLLVRVSDPQPDNVAARLQHVTSRN